MAASVPDTRTVPRGTPELSRCREGNDFLSAPLTLARYWDSLGQDRREEKAKLCCEFGIIMDLTLLLLLAMLSLWVAARQ
jgi:hypothetical protein